MASAAGWYTGLIDIGSVADMKAGTSQTQQATVFQWGNAKAKPTVATANITGLAAITGGPYPTKAAATAAADGTGSSGLPGTGKQAGVSSSAVNSANGITPSLPDPLSGLAAVGDFFGRLTEAATWTRVAKVIVGAALVLIGLAHMTGADTAVARAARSVPVPI